MTAHAAQPPEYGTDRLLTPDEVAHILGVPRQTLLYWRTAQGKGPTAHRIGRHLRYRRSEVEAWIDSRADDRPPAA